MSDLNNNEQNIEKITEEYLDNLEKEWGISFPVVLREFYLHSVNYKPSSFIKNDMEFCISFIYKPKHKTIPLEKMMKYKQKDDCIPSTFIPLAIDEYEDDYYWDAKDGKVYYYETVTETYFEIFASVEEFFEMLEVC